MIKIINLFTTRRNFIKTISSTALGFCLGPKMKSATAQTVADNNKVGSWIKDTYRELLVANHMPEEWENVWSQFDANATAQMFAGAGIQKVCYVAKDAYGFSYYPTKFGSVHSHMSKDRDEVGEFTAALKKKGIRCIPYFYPGVDRIYYKTNPEWRFSDKNAMSSNNYVTMCFNSPYTDEVAIPQMKELLTKYDLDGLFLDIVVHPYMIWNCRCKYCRDLYAKEMGGEIPKDGDDPRAFAYRKWLNTHMDRLFDKFYNELSAVKPGIIIEYNMAWNYRYPINPPGYVPFITLDPPTPDLGTYSWNFSLESRYFSTVPNVAWSCMNTRMNSWGDFVIREEEAMMQECAILLAGCGKTYLSDMPYPSGRFEPEVYELFSKINKRTEELESYVKGCHPVKDVAVLNTADTIWSKAPLSPFPEWRGGPAYYPINGAHKALIEGHAQMSILNSQVCLNTLNEYGALILPDQRILSAKEIDKIKQFVYDGGALIATFETGTRDNDNNKLNNFALSDVLGIRYVNSADTANCYLQTTPELKPYGIPAMDVQVNAPYTTIETTAAKSLLSLVPPFQDIKTGTPPPAESPVGPGVTTNQFGKGRALYFSPEIFGAYFRADTPVMRKLVLWALAHVYPNESRQIFLENTPINVEVFYNQRGNERYIHFINYSGDKRDIGPAQAQDFPIIHGIKINVRLENKPSRVRLVPDMKNITFEYLNGWLQFYADSLKIHDVYQILI